MEAIIYTIELPTKHSCSSICKYIYDDLDEQYINPNYKDGVCEKCNMEEDHTPINIFSYKENIEQYLNLDEIVITDKDIKINFTFPLSYDINHDIHNDNGFTRKELITIIHDKFHELYKEEEETSKPYDDRDKEIMGKYGIYQDFEDLWLDQLVYSSKEKTLYLGIQI